MKGRKLLPPKNIRYVSKPLCYTCKYGNYPGDIFECLRDPENTYWDVGDGWEYIRVCDRYVKEKYFKAPSAPRL